MRSKFFHAVLLTGLAALTWAEPGAAVSMGDIQREQEKQAPPVLSVTPGTLEATLKQDETSSLKLTISNRGGQTLKWSFGAMPSWISANPKQGELPYQGKQTVSVSLNPKGLTPGAVKGQMRIEAPGVKGSPAVISFSFQVRPEDKPEPPPDEPESQDLPPDVVQGGTKAPDGKPPPGSGEPVDKPPGSGAPVVKPPEQPPVVHGIDRREPAGADVERIHTLGVRGGLLMPGSSDIEDYDQGFTLGFFWRPDRGESRFGYELEVGFGQSESDSGLSSSTLISGRANALWRLNRSESNRLYAVGGLSIVSEQVDDEDLGSDSTLGASLDLGAGATFAGRFDLRLTYSLLFASDNIGSAVGATVGVMF